MNGDVWWDASWNYSGNTNTAMHILLRTQAFPNWQHVECFTDLPESLCFVATCEEKGLQQLTRHSALPLSLPLVTRWTKQSGLSGSAGLCCCKGTCCSQSLLMLPFQTHDSCCQEEHGPSEHFCHKGDPDQGQGPAKPDIDFHQEILAPQEANSFLESSSRICNVDTDPCKGNESWKEKHVQLLSSHWGN